jgi:hypothetical protein
MKQVVINIQEGKYRFFMELIKSLDFVQVQEEGDTKEDIIANLKNGLMELKLYKQDKLKTTAAKDFLDEL